jgi:ubiquinone/menaquinone biosynthesis C-methylase UbiE
MLEYAKKQHPNLEFAIADAHHIPLENESIDTVLCVGLFEYIERPVVLEEIKRVLKPGGIGIILCPNKFSAARAKDKLYYKIVKKSYQGKEPSYGEMLRLFKQKKLSIIASKMDDGLVWMPGFLDRLVGRWAYLLVERIFKIFGRNPFSNEMLFVIRKA